MREFGSVVVSSALVACLVPVLLAQEPDSTANPNEVTIPEGTEFKLQLHTTLNSKTSKPGDRVLTTLLDPVDVEDQDVLPKGLRIDGHLGEVKAAGRRGKGGYLTIVFDTVELSDGRVGKVVRSNREHFTQPVVEVWRRLAPQDAESVDLSKHAELSIIRALRPGRGGTLE